MVNVLTLAILSANTYNPKVNTFSKKFENIVTNDIKDGVLQHLPGDKLFWGIMTDAVPHVKTSSPFYAALYVYFVNREPKDAVIAFRGTDKHFINNYYVDFKTWRSDVVGGGLYDQIPAYQPRAHSFLIQAERYLREHLPSLRRTTLTGHSLGGSLAQLLVARGGFARQTVTFNAPGISHLPGVNPDFAPYIHNMNSRFGFLNKIGKVIGKIQYVDVKQGEFAAKQAFVDYHKLMSGDADNAEFNRLETNIGDDMFFSLLEQHSIKNIIAALREQQYSSVADEVFV